MKLIKLSSITKKMSLAAVGLFLLIFLPIHAGINLCIMRSDSGYWYRNACHFMGTNYIVKVFEIILLATIVLHIVLAIILTVENYFARPIRYSTPHKTKTHWGSKYMIWTGGLIACFLILHFINFYFVKLNLVEGKYTAKIEKVDERFQNKVRQMQNGELNQTISNELASQYEAINSISEDKVSQKDKSFVNLTKNEVEKYCGKDFEDYEPDFYTMANDLFKNKIYTFIYLFIFVVLGIHLFHAINSVFQTFGFAHRKYEKYIEYLALIYAVVIPGLFAAVPVFVMFFK
ncbi:MAG: succinate dehydrogenase cytochrome b subunit [Bacteroidales bacterium]|jgi:succinate dehydrogenase/fumarate reductase cytochrome b subunit (b558 family)|nr:succinate dehydrogenase cytochrome b subunit [Bacteroidales bacterium]